MGEQTDQAQGRGAAATSATRAARASLPRPGLFPEPRHGGEEVGGRGKRWEGGGRGGREGKRPPLPAWLLLSRPRRRKLATGFPGSEGLVHPSCPSAHGILWWGDPLAAGLRAGRGSGGNVIPTLERQLYAAGTPVPTLPSGKPRFFLLVQWILIQIHLRTMRSDAGVEV